VAVNWLVGELEAAEVVGEVEAAGGRAMAVRADVRSEADVVAMFRQVRERFGSVDILINNAGILREAAFVDKTLADWDAVLGVNLTGQFLCAREAAREFLRRGLQPDLSRAVGKIVCISSIHDSVPRPGCVDYAVSKAGVTMLVKALALELGPHRIRVNGVSPGLIRTGADDEAALFALAEGAARDHIPYGRTGEPDDIARAVVWLSSDDSDYLTGASLYIDGARRLYRGYAAQA
jgi:glucose 1-dehydrogenase